MRLLKLRANKIGPFATPFEIEFDPRVTILTGANDAGKSSVLRALKMAVTGESVGPKDANRDHLIAASSPWSLDGTYYLDCDYEISQAAELNGFSIPAMPALGRLSRSPAPQVNGATFQVIMPDKRVRGPDASMLFHLPVCISLGVEERYNMVRSVVPLDQINSVETALLQLAFKGGFNPAKFRALDAGAQEEVLTDAEDNLKELLKSVLPKTDFFTFRLRNVDDGGKIAISVHDLQRARTPFEFRGSGARKMITLLARLLVEGKTGVHRLVLIDEPENSLHADAQHLLREFLFDLTKDGKTQVIYATHSPCMLNPMRPGQVRLLERRRAGDVATSVIVSRPEDLGFSAVRASWGLTAVDSLLYAPVTVIVEGATEVRCFPEIMDKLAKLGKQEFTEYERLLGLVYFVGGRGQSHSVVAKLAEAQGTRVIVFLDGDNHAAAQKQKLEQQVPGAAVILLPEGKVFEDLVPRRCYFEALASFLENEDGPSLEARFEAWGKSSASLARASFSNRLAKWLLDEFPDRKMVESKPEVMLKAVSLCDPSEITNEPFVAFLEAVRRHLSSTSFGR